MTIEFQHH